MCINISKFYQGMAKRNNSRYQYNIRIPDKLAKKGVVILGLDEYRRLEKQVVSTYYLGGEAAKRLDKLVEEGVREYKKGKTKKIKSLADLD